MPMEITFTLSDQDLDHFRQIVEKTRAAVDCEKDGPRIEDAARQLIDDARKRDLPAYVAERLEKLAVVLRMVDDEEWRLAHAERCRILDALVYFCSTEDLIPDHIPALGYLDDAIYTELVLRELKTEIALYEEFCEYRTAEEKRRSAAGLDPRVEREEWLAVKRASLHKSMVRRRHPRLAWLLRW